MVTVYDKDGKPLYKEPPYTWEEEQEFYRRVGGGPKAILRSRRPGEKPPQEPQEQGAAGQGREEEPRS